MECRLQRNQQRLREQLDAGEEVMVRGRYNLPDSLHYLKIVLKSTAPVLVSRLELSLAIVLGLPVTRCYEVVRRLRGLSIKNKIRIKNSDAISASHFYSSVSPMTARLLMRAGELPRFAAAPESAFRSCRRRAENARGFSCRPAYGGASCIRSFQQLVLTYLVGFQRLNIFSIADERRSRARND